MPGFPQKGIKTPCIIPSFLSLHSHRCLLSSTQTRRHLACTLSLLSIREHFHVYVVCMCCFVCVHACDCVGCVCVCSPSSCVPNWLWHICGFSRRIRAGAKLPRNQCNRLGSPPFPSYSSLPAPQSAPSVASLSFFLPLSCLEPLLKMEWVCAAYLKWSWMDLNGWWYLVSPQGAAMSP